METEDVQSTADWEDRHGVKWTAQRAQLLHDAELKQFKWSQVNEYVAALHRILDEAYPKSHYAKKGSKEWNRDIQYLLKTHLESPNKSIYLRQVASMQAVDLSEARKAREAQEVAERIEKSKQAEAKFEAMKMRAINWLQNEGKTLGVDFNLSNAIEYANHLAAEQYKQKVIDEGIPLEFDGNEYCEDDGCAWYPETLDDLMGSRCSCGNRRVQLVRHDSHTFENPLMYAEAY